jgi:HK97 family phage major capsid protein
MPTETYRFPKITTGANVYFVGEAVSAPEPTVSTGQVELVSKKLMAAITMSAELEEDEPNASSINHIKTVKDFQES